jgi:hypothetical protein
MPPPRSEALRSKRLLPVLAHRPEVHRPLIAMVEQVEKLHHGIDLVEVFGHWEARDLRLEGLAPWRANRQVDALARSTLPSAGPVLRPVLGEASYGNVVVSCAVGTSICADYPLNIRMRPV